MKTISSGLQSHLDGRAHTLAYIVKFTRPDGEVVAVTDHSKQLTVDGTTYEPGLRLDSLSSTVGLEVDNTNFDFVSATPIVATADLLSGVWDGTEVLIQQVNWKSLGDGTIAHKRGHIGNTSRGMGVVTLEFRDLRQALRTDTSAIFQANCRARLGDTKCTVDLEPWTFTGSVTAVTSNRLITDSALTEAAGTFTEGYLTFTGGLNAGKPAVKVTLHEAGGVLHLETDLIDLIDIGDTFEVVAGCLKRYTEDCVGKFDNGLNFQAEKDKPQVEEFVKDPTR